jgi:hypothetical protein
MPAVCQHASEFRQQLAPDANQLLNRASLASLKALYFKSIPGWHGFRNMVFARQPLQQFFAGRGLQLEETPATEAGPWQLISNPFDPATSNPVTERRALTVIFWPAGCPDPLASYP